MTKDFQDTTITTLVDSLQSAAEEQLNTLESALDTGKDDTNESDTSEDTETNAEAEAETTTAN
jgi:hypothetical protein